MTLWVLVLTVVRLAVNVFALVLQLGIAEDIAELKRQRECGMNL
jgi:hypothetical protein